MTLILFMSNENLDLLSHFFDSHISKTQYQRKEERHDKKKMKKAEEKNDIIFYQL
jgi:hypothetical protein